MNRGLFEPTVMFFDLTNSSATFQTMMDELFKEEIAKGNVIIYSRWMTYSLLHQTILIIIAKEVTNVLSKLLSNNLFLKPEKCVFHQREVEYLGIIVGNGKVKMDPVKVKGLAD